MNQDDPVSEWIEQLRDDDSLAAINLWERFFGRLQEIARTRLRSKTRRVYDEDDAAQSAFHSVCEGLIEGRFPDLKDRDSLWKMMLVITANKISNRHRYDHQDRRDVRRTFTDSQLMQSIEELPAGSLRIDALDPSPEFAEHFVSVCDSLIECLDDSSLSEVALLRVEGLNDSEIADRLNCSRRTVQRRLEVIRRRWGELNFTND